MAAKQIDLFDHVLDVYADQSGSISNEELYRHVGERAGLPVHGATMPLKPNQPRLRKRSGRASVLIE